MNFNFKRDSPPAPINALVTPLLRHIVKAFCAVSGPIQIQVYNVTNRGAGSNLGQGGGSISKKGTLFYFGKQAEKPNFKKSLSLLNLYDWKMDCHGSERVVHIEWLCTCAFGNIIFNYCYKNKIRIC